MKVPTAVNPALERAWSRSGRAFGRGWYLIWRNVLTGASMGWPGCQYKLGMCLGRLVKSLPISFDLIGCTEFCCGTCCCCAEGSGADGCSASWFDFAAMSWSSILIIWSARTFSFARQRALHTGISCFQSPSVFSRKFMASMRLSSQVII